MVLRKSLLKTPNKLAVLQKEFIARIQSHVAPIFLVNEYPKCGGTWLKHMLAEALGHPVWTKGRPVWAPCVMQAHWLSRRGNCRTLVLFRDGRDVMVSYYYHSLFKNDLQNGPLVELMNEYLPMTDREDIRANLLSFIKITLGDPVTPAFSWVDFVHRWSDDLDVVKCRYEDLRTDTVGELCRITKALSGIELCRTRAEEIVEAYSIENMRDRRKELNPGVRIVEKPETNFIRKGLVGGWSEYFTDETLIWFEDRAGSALDRLGYARGRPNEIKKRKGA